MARRKPTSPAAAEAGVVLPERLVKRLPYSSREEAEAARQQHRERDQWLRDRGVSPGDWSKVYPIMQASRLVYGLPRRRLIV